MQMVMNLSMLFSVKSCTSINYVPVAYSLFGSLPNAGAAHPLIVFVHRLYPLGEDGYELRVGLLTQIHVDVLDYLTSTQCVTPLTDRSWTGVPFYSMYNAF